MAEATGLRGFLVADGKAVSVAHAARTAVAAVISFELARLLGFREAYWAPISTMIVMQSTLGAALPVSAQRFIGTALGALAGAVCAAYFGRNPLAFGGAIFALGLACWILHVDRAAYRYAGITLAIVMLVVRTTGVWLIAIHRFLEVSTGIAVGLALSALWPERSALPRASAQSDCSFRSK